LADIKPCLPAIATPVRVATQSVAGGRSVADGPTRTIMVNLNNNLKKHKKMSLADIKNKLYKKEEDKNLYQHAESEFDARSSLSGSDESGKKFSSEN